MSNRYMNALETFTRIAKYDSFSSAADALNLTKGAVSHQVRKLEDTLGFQLFERLPRGITLTEKGNKLLLASSSAFDQLDGVIRKLNRANQASVTIAVSSYFASRWLSQRLMHFMSARPDVQIRIQPMINLQQIEDQNVDLVIRWGNGNWQDIDTECLFLSPAFPAGNQEVAKLVKENGFAAVRLLRDWDGSTAWQDWHSVAGVPFGNESDSLVIPDPNVRVQAMIDGQGIALMDDLISTELSDGKLERLTAFSLDNYGYFLAKMPGYADNSAAVAFSIWLHEQSSAFD
ncbi:MAG: LysR family transcriptional regulator [Rhizobiaceae bacterium]